MNNFDMESNLKLLKSSCEFCCKLQKDIIELKKFEITPEFKNEVISKFKSLVTSASNHIGHIINFQLNCWHLSIKAINYLYCELSRDHTNKSIQNEFKKIFLLHFQLLDQMFIDTRHFYDGKIRLSGESIEAEQNGSFYIRSCNINGLDKHNINELVGNKYSEEDKYSCISFDGLKILSIQLFHFCKENEIIIEDFNYNKVERIIESSINQNITTAKDIITEQNSNRKEKIFKTIITFDKNKSTFYNKTSYKYQIDVRIKVFIFIID